MNLLKRRICCREFYVRKGQAGNTKDHGHTSGRITFSVSHPKKQNNGGKRWASRRQSRCCAWERVAEMTSWDQNCTKPSALDQEFGYWLIIPRNNGKLSACLPLCVCSCVQISVYLGMCVEVRCQPWVGLKLSSLFWETLLPCLFFFFCFFFVFYLFFIIKI